MHHLFPQIVNRHGPEADRHLLRCLFSHVDFSGDGKSSGKDFHQVCGIRLLRICSTFISLSICLIFYFLPYFFRHSF